MREFGFSLLNTECMQIYTFAALGTTVEHSQASVNVVQHHCDLGRYKDHHCYFQHIGRYVFFP